MQQIDEKDRDLYLYSEILKVPEQVVRGKLERYFWRLQDKNDLTAQDRSIQVRGRKVQLHVQYHLRFPLAPSTAPSIESATSESSSSSGSSRSYGSTTTSSEGASKTQPLKVLYQRAQQIL